MEFPFLSALNGNNCYEVIDSHRGKKAVQQMALRTTRVEESKLVVTKEKQEENLCTLDFRVEFKNHQTWSNDFAIKMKEIRLIHFSRTDSFFQAFL